MKTETETRPFAGRYANILLDYWFKRAFGTESRKRLLLLFLRELIPERDIQSLTYAPQEHPNPWPGQKDVRVDVECTDADGTRFIVELQLARQAAFYERAVFYSTFAIQEQMKKGATDYSFPAVYFIGLMDFSLHEGPQVVYRYSLRDEGGKPMTDRLHYIFLELPNAGEGPRPDGSVLENFCWALHNLARLERKPEGLEAEIFRLLFESADIATFTPEEQIRYENDMTTERDIRNQIAYAREEGLAEGRIEGERNRNLAIARQMLTDGLPADAISKYTGLSDADIKSLNRS